MSIFWRIEGKEFVGSNFTVKQQQQTNNTCWFTIVDVIFCRGFIENKFALSPSICMHATFCVAVRRCLKIYIFILYYSWNELCSSIGTYVQPANQFVNITITLERYKIAYWNFTAELSYQCMSYRQEWKLLYSISSFWVMCPWSIFLMGR